MRALKWAAVILMVSISGCATQQARVLGKAPSGQIVPVSQLKSTAGQVTIRGTMYEKCPVAGCWFMIRDKSGVVRVDAKSSGFTVTDVPVNSEVTVQGSVKTVGEKMVIASGMQY